MFCRKCGYQNEDDARFCMNCGTNLSEAALEDKPKENEKPAEEEPAQPAEEKINEQPDLYSQFGAQSRTEPQPQDQAQPNSQYQEIPPQAGYQVNYQQNGNVHGGYAYYQYVPVPPVPGKGLAIASMVLGIVSLCLCTTFIPAILAIIFGAVARGKGYRGGMSTAGIVCGIISLVLVLLYIVLAVVVGIGVATSEVFYY